MTVISIGMRSLNYILTNFCDLFKGDGVEAIVPIVSNSDFSILYLDLS